ncbi:MAG: ACT domain-containing protein, partial [Verrucomicrobiae bacterium]|nr:ACT domain-containing protein [Verrucomicrobiae bacterium]
RGVAVDKKQAKVTVAHVPDKPGMAARIFRAVADANVNVDVIVQNVSEKGTTDVTFTVGTDDLKKALVTLEPLAKTIGAGGVTAKDGIAKVSIVGVGMKSHPGVAADMFEALAAAGINIQMISTSEIKISVVVDLQDADKAANVLHEKFGLGKK